MRRRAKVDRNHAEIVEALRVKGWSVISLAPLGRGVPDLLIRRELPLCVDCLCDAEMYLVEIKDGSKPPSARKLTKAEAEFHKRWPVTILRSVDDALSL